MERLRIAFGRAEGKQERNAIALEMLEKANMDVRRGDAWSPVGMRLGEGDRQPPESAAASKVRLGHIDVRPSMPAVLRGRITVSLVLEMTADHFGLTVRDLVSHGRTQPLARNRQIAMYVARTATRSSLPYIASRLGGRDHTTVLQGVETVKERLDAGDADGGRRSSDHGAAAHRHRSGETPSLPASPI
jgi:Bacterial dnaA protein helix-turn-helix